MVCSSFPMFGGLSKKKTRCELDSDGMTGFWEKKRGFVFFLKGRAGGCRNFPCLYLANLPSLNIYLHQMPLSL